MGIQHLRLAGLERDGLPGRALLLVDALSWGLAFQYPPIHPYLGIQQRIGVFGALVWWAMLLTRLERGSSGSTHMPRLT